MLGTLRAKGPGRASARPEHDADRSARETLISQVLESLQFQGWYFCVSQLSAPWALQLPGGRLAALHAVLEGECTLTFAGQSRGVRLQAGDVAVLPRDEVHAMSDREGREPLPVSMLHGLDQRDRRATTLTHGGGGANVRLLTASFVAESRTAHAIVAGLPALMVLRNGTAARERVGPVLSLAQVETAQQGGVSSAVLRRAAEILFIQTLREALLDARPATGWLAAASDPRLVDALTAMHEQPDRRWTLNELARLAHLSRTAFFERFQACLGQTPADYLLWWRLQLAAQRLRDTDDSVANIALAVGYDNASAFARAFKRLMGRSPNEFRAAREVSM